MGLTLPYGNTDNNDNHAGADNRVEFIPYGAPIESLLDNKAPKQLKADIEFLYDLLKGITIFGFEKWSPTATYEEGEIVIDETGNLYRSLGSENTSLLSDSTKWKPLGLNLDDIGVVYSISNIDDDAILSPFSSNYIDTSFDRLNLQLPVNPDKGVSIIVKDAKDNAQNKPVRVFSIDKSIVKDVENEIYLDVNGFMVEFKFDGEKWFVINIG